MNKLYSLIFFIYRFKAIPSFNYRVFRSIIFIFIYILSAFDFFEKYNNKEINLADDSIKQLRATLNWYDNVHDSIKLIMIYSDGCMIAYNYSLIAET